MIGKHDLEYCNSFSLATILQASQACKKVPILLQTVVYEGGNGYAFCKIKRGTMFEIRISSTVLVIL